jgi:5-deoxy-glucuronate isomerase
VRTGTGEHGLTGRAGVFAGPTDVLYLPQGTTAVITSAAGARVALPGARVTAAGGTAPEPLPVRHVPVDEVPVELRGAGSCTRQVHNFASADVRVAHRLIAVEVITPGGNWSSYPPHKHDETSAHESELEEVYYYEVAPGPGGEPGLGYHRTSGTPQRPVDVLAEVRDRDTVLVPSGWHGPAIAAPGNDLYYLNAMAGPGEDRAWRIVDDPRAAWVRRSWESQRPDPRLPLHAPAGRLEGEHR